MGRYNDTGLFSGPNSPKQMSLDNYETDRKVDEIDSLLKENTSSSEKDGCSSFNSAGSSDVRAVDQVNEFKMDSHGSAPTKGQPNSVTKVYKNKKLEQERYYDNNGDVYLDIDYSDHGNPKKHPVVPHQHQWKKDDKGKTIRGIWEKIKK